MTSQVVQGTWLKKGGYGRFRGQCVNKLTIYLRYSVLRFNYQQSLHCTYIPIRDILNLVLRFYKQLLLHIVIVHAVGAKRFPLLMIQLSLVTHNELRRSAPKSFDEVWVQDNTASLSWPGLLNETKNVRLTVTTFDFLGFKNSRGLHLSEERYLERFSCLKFIIRFFILLGITVM